MVKSAFISCLLNPLKREDGIIVDLTLTVMKTGPKIFQLCTAGDFFKNLATREAAKQAKRLETITITSSRRLNYHNNLSHIICKCNLWHYSSK